MSAFIVSDLGIRQLSSVKTLKVYVKLRQVSSVLVPLADSPSWMLGKREKEKGLEGKDENYIL